MHNLTFGIELNIFFDVGLSLAGMNHVTDGLWNSCLPRLKFAQILIMGSAERMAVKIHVDHLIDAIAKHCSKLERLEFRSGNSLILEQ